MPPKTLAKVGLVALALALLLPWGYAHWLKTRTFDPVDKAVTLEAGRVHTEDFEINLREDYHVQIDVSYGPDYVDEERECPFYQWSDTDWKVYRLSGHGWRKESRGQARLKCGNRAKSRLASKEDRGDMNWNGVCRLRGPA